MISQRQADIFNRFKEKVNPLVTVVVATSFDKSPMDGCEVTITAAIEGTRDSRPDILNKLKQSPVFSKMTLMDDKMYVWSNSYHQAMSDVSRYFDRVQEELIKLNITNEIIATNHNGNAKMLFASITFRPNK